MPQCLHFFVPPVSTRLTINLGVFSYNDHRLAYVTCFSQWDLSKCDTSGGLKSVWVNDITLSHPCFSATITRTCSGYVAG